MAVGDLLSFRQVHSYCDLDLTNCLLIPSGSPGQGLVDLLPKGATEHNTCFSFTKSKKYSVSTCLPLEESNLTSLLKSFTLRNKWVEERVNRMFTFQSN